jgi:hypothetical protein
MSTSAWIFMLSMWAFIVGSMVYCFWKLLTSPRRLDLDVEMQEVIEYETLPKPDQPKPN